MKVKILIALFILAISGCSTIQLPNEENIIEAFKKRYGDQIAVTVLQHSKGEISEEAGIKYCTVIVSAIIEYQEDKIMGIKMLNRQGDKYKVTDAAVSFSWIESSRIWYSSGNVQLLIPPEQLN